MEETWKTVEDAPDYAVSDMGRVRRITRGIHTYPGRILKQRPEGYAANHIIPNKRDNCLANLEWVTVTENNVHALRCGLRSNGIGDTTFNAKLKDGEVWLIKKLLHSGKVSQRFIAKMFKVHFATINSIKIGKNWSHIIYSE